MRYGLNFGELYGQICRDLPMPESLVEKMIAFHLGQMALNVDDMSEMSAFMHHRFKRFAESLPGFRVTHSKLDCNSWPNGNLICLVFTQELNQYDQDFLVNSNSSLYFQVELLQFAASALLNPFIYLTLVLSCEIYEFWQCQRTSSGILGLQSSRRLVNVSALPHHVLYLFRIRPKIVLF